MPQTKTANQSLFEATIRHQVHVLRFGEGEAKRAKEALDQAEQELLELIAGRMAKGMEASRLESLLTSIKERRQQVYSGLTDQMKESLTGFSEAEGEWEEGALQGSSPIQLNLASVPLEQLHATVASPIAGIPLDGWLNNISSAEGLALQSAVTQAVLQGGTIDDLVRRIRGTKAKNFSDGILAKSTLHAQALARTAVNHVSNAAREQVWEANSDIVRALRWTSTLDGRTSDVCKSRDGHLAPIGDSSLLPSDQPLIPPGARPPAHFNCRSVLVAILDGVELSGDRPTVADKRTRAEREKAFRAEAKEKGISIQEVRAQWAAKNVGNVPSATTYGEWLKGQPASFQDEVLGVGKADLFRKGVPLERFVDASGKSLTLAELKAELAGDALNVIQPAIGVKAKGLLMQGLSPDEVLGAIKSEFPEATTSAASIASYKSELKKAGLLPTGAKPTFDQMYQVGSLPDELKKFEAVLPPGVKSAIGGEWATMVDELQGHPGAYAHYKPGVGVELSGKLMTMPKAQAKQVMAHELGHMLHKVHGLVDLDDTFLLDDFKEFVALDPSGQMGKLYSYYGVNKDELWAEIVGQALHDSPVTSQGIEAGPFKSFFAGKIDLAKKLLADKFPDVPAMPSTGPVIQGIGEVAGKPTSIGGYAKALLQQGMKDQEVLDAVMAEFPNAKTTMNSIKSYKSELKKVEQLSIGKGTSTVTSSVKPITQAASPLTPVSPKVVGSADPAAFVPKASGDTVPLSGLTKTGGKPGGSNPGALYKDAKGDEWLVKGNVQKVNGNVSAALSDSRARNEVLAAKLIRMSDPALAPEMKLVDLEGQFGGGQGVMSKMLDKPIVKFDVNNSMHVAIAQEDFALHAWLGNYDVVGASFDNLVVKGGKAVNIDPGGALLFRAQGLAKTDFGPDADTWVTMRKGTKNPNAKAVYGSMTDTQLQASAKKLLIYTDDKIDELVAAFGPHGEPISDAELASILKARRDTILKNVGLSKPTLVDAPPGPSTGLPVLDKFNGLSNDAAAVLMDLMDNSLGDDALALAKMNGIDLTQAELNKLADELMFKPPVFKAPEAVINSGATPALDGLPDNVKATLTYMLDEQKKYPDTITDEKIADQINKFYKFVDGEDAILPYEVTVYKEWKTGVPTKPDVPVPAPVAAPVNYKAMNAQQLVEAVVPPNLKINSWQGKTKASWTIQQAAAPLFKTGVSTDKVYEALVLKFGSTHVPKVPSLASMKSKLKKQGLLDGPIGVVAPQEVLPTPKLWGVNLGSKSSTVKEGAKNLIQANTDAKDVVNWIGQQFSSFDATGAQNLYELAYYEVKTGKAIAKPGVAAASKSYDQLPAPVPLRPANRIGEAGPPPPRFTPEGHRAGLQKYGGLEATNDTAALSRVNKVQKAAGLEDLTPEEYAAVKAYTGSAYGRVNSLLRDGAFADDMHLQAWSDAAMQGLHKMAPYRGDVIRGMSVNSSTVEQLRRRYLPGAVVEETQFTSTSMVDRGGKGFGGNVKYYIKVKTGRDVKFISSYKGEEEVLLVPGTKYLVQRVEGTGSDMSIYMEEV